MNRNIYGSKLLGQEEIYEVIASTDNNVVDINTNTDMVIGDKRYTLSNHLGNQHDTWVFPNKILSGISPDWSISGTSGVHQVVTDRKIPEEDNGDIAYFYPNVVSYSDFLPFGMEIEARSSSTSETDFGFNGMYADDEWKGKRNSYDFGARMYDSRVGRWLSRDPKESKQPDQSGYKAFYNAPLLFVDPDGRTEYLAITLKDDKTGKSQTLIVEVSDDLDASHVQSNSMVGYYDYYTTMTVTRDKEGNYSREKDEARSWLTPDEPRISLPYGVGGAPLARILTKDQSGGFYMTSKDGMGTIFKSENPPKYIGNIDLLSFALSTVKRTHKFAKLAGLDKGSKLKGIANATKEELFVEALKVTAPGAIKEMQEFFDNVFNEEVSESEPEKSTGEGNNVTGEGGSKWETLETTGEKGQPHSTITSRKEKETYTVTKKDSLDHKGIKRRASTDIQNKD